jgi:hypothetical protein
VIAIPVAAAIPTVIVVIIDGLDVRIHGLREGRYRFQKRKTSDQSQT